MRPDVAIERLAALREELALLPQATTTATITTWFGKTEQVLSGALGDSDPIVRRFDNLEWPLPRWSMPNARARLVELMEPGRGVLDAAIATLKYRIEDTEATSDDGYDPELWEHVAPEIAVEEWSKAAALATRFTEDRIRRWTGQPDGALFKDIAIGALGPGGDFRMGRTDGEKEGWKLFGMGIAGAARNVDAHRIQDRPDLRRYALGVIGACSLLLTQLRFEHGNRFLDTSPAQAEIEGPE